MLSIIQGGMGVALSNYKLANAVSKEGSLGVISGVGLDTIILGRLQEGDKNGVVREALAQFPDHDIAQKIIDKYYVKDGIEPGTPLASTPLWSMKPNKWLQQVVVASSFIEVWLSKKGHNNPVGLNLMEKTFAPNQALLYGAMLAGIDYVIMGAGIPLQMPGIITQLVNHNDSNYRVDCVDARPDDDLRLHFKISELFPNFKEKLGTLKRPKFFPIISSNVLALALIKRGTGKIDGFIVETPVAGGHNAPPRKEQYNEKNEPVYGAKDVVDLEKLAKLGLPFWLAGGYGNRDGLQKALASGAQGIQVGTAFAYTNESGMRDDIKNNVLKRAAEGNIEFITSARCSPSGFPFKVVQLEGSSSDEKTYKARKRVCDKGHLRHAYRRPDGTIGLRCPAESVDIYIKKGGKLEDTVGRRCLCNALISTVGFPQIRKGGYREDYIVTSGDDVVNLKLFQKEGKLNYSAKDVLDVLKSKTKTTT